jgi:hypothetical protein
MKCCARFAREAPAARQRCQNSPVVEEERPQPFGQVEQVGRAPYTSIRARLRGPMRTPREAEAKQA